MPCCAWALSRSAAAAALQLPEEPRLPRTVVDGFGPRRLLRVAEHSPCRCFANRFPRSPRARVPVHCACRWRPTCTPGVARTLPASCGSECICRTWIRHCCSAWPARAAFHAAGESGAPGWTGAGSAGEPALFRRGWPSSQAVALARSMRSRRCCLRADTAGRPGRRARGQVPKSLILAATGQLRHCPSGCCAGRSRWWSVSHARACAAWDRLCACPAPVSHDALAQPRTRHLRCPQRRNPPVRRLFKAREHFRRRRELSCELNSHELLNALTPLLGELGKFLERASAASCSLRAASCTATPQRAACSGSRPRHSWPAFAGLLRDAGDAHLARAGAYARAARGHAAVTRTARSRRCGSPVSRAAVGSEAHELIERLRAA